MRNSFQPDLFSTNYSLKIVRLNPSDVKLESDNFKLFKKIVSRHENMYPNIEKWLKNKVVPGIKSRERMGYLGFDSEKPIVSAVLKKGRFAKFCHLHIEEKYQNMGIGDIFFSMMALEIRKKTNYVNFTLPESLWMRKRKFFESFGFKNAKKSETQYRNFEDELKCYAQFKTVWRNALKKIPILINSCTNSNMNIFNGLLLSIKPKYVHKLCEGDKVVEIRKRFNPKWKGCKAFIYSTSPSKALYGRATIKFVDRGNPELIWEKYKEKVGGTKEEFDKYTKDSKRIYAISLNSFDQYIQPLYLEQLSYLLNKNLRAPQSYLSLVNNQEWTEAISIAELLDGKFQLYLKNDAITM